MWAVERLGALYFDYLAQADADPNVKAIVVTGAGRSFCVGADMGQFDTTIHPSIMNVPCSLSKSLIGEAKPNQRLLEKAALLHPSYADVRSILMGLLHSKGTECCGLLDAPKNFMR